MTTPSRREVVLSRGKVLVQRVRSSSSAKEFFTHPKRREAWCPDLPVTKPGILTTLSRGSAPMEGIRVFLSLQQPVATSQYGLQASSPPYRSLAKERCNR